MKSDLPQRQRRERSRRLPGHKRGRPAARECGERHSENENYRWMA